MNKATDRLFLRQAFKSVMEVYSEVKATCGTTPTLDYSVLANRMLITGTPNPRVVRPSMSDFICDVELKTKSVLSAKEYGWFVDIFVNKALPEMTCSVNQLHKIQEKVGGVLVSARIHPIEQYFMAKDMR